MDFIATALAAGAIGAVGALGVNYGIRGARKVRSSYGTSVEQMRGQQQAAGYYNQQPYYEHPGASDYNHYPTSGYHGRHSYGYRY